MAKPILVFDYGSEDSYANNYANSAVYSGINSQFYIHGTVGAEFVLDDNGATVIDENRGPMLARDLNGNPKRGPIMMTWEPEAIYNDYVGVYHGAWMAATSESSSSSVSSPGSSFANWRHLMPVTT